jgi:RimJ/RimL family protein N-acetyltransferase
MGEERVWIDRWTADDLPVLLSQNTWQMTQYLGGPEDEEKVRQRHEKFLRDLKSKATWPFTIHSGAYAQPVGSVVYWLTRHHEEDGYEIGWAVSREYQGHGYASSGVRLALEHAALHGDRDLVWAFPRTDNAPSNALARAAGFRNSGEEDFEYPKGSPIKVNAWVFDLAALRRTSCSSHGRRDQRGVS